jgi:hypothetical protein
VIGRGNSFAKGIGIMRTSYKTIDRDVLYVGWLFSGVVSFFITFVIAIVMSVFVIEKVVGDTIVVAGQTRITQDSMLAYAFIPWFGMVIGVIQYLLLSLRLPRMGWWILTTTLGWSLVFLGLGLRYNPLGNVVIIESVWYSMAAGIIIGLIIGLAQWGILQVHLPHAAWWIPVNMLGFGVAGLIFDGISSIWEALVAFTATSFFTGILLWLLFDKLPCDENYNENVPSNSALT